MKKDIVLDLTMEALKGYTDLEQSKSLAEFLPIESADMHYLTYSMYEEYCDEIVYTANLGKHGMYDKCCIPCWSLAALLNYLREVDYFPEINADEFEVTMSITYYNDHEARPLAPVQNIKVEAESFIDACVTMIEKLHEQNLL